MSTTQFTKEFKLEVVKQIIKHQRPAANVAQRMGLQPIV